jgi:hypothetical protein
MHQRTVDQITEWPTERLVGGYEGLHRLAGESFTGAVTADGSWLFMLNGRCVGVPEGRLADFADADGTAHSAPAPVLPLLFAMLAADGDDRGTYYTDRTPIREVHATLREGGFTGYLELSEKVLSGDYYVAYYGGDPRYAAFVGESDRLLTGETAFDRACDEVGLYAVTATTLDVRDVPGRSSVTRSTADPSTGSESGAAPDGTTGERDLPGPTGQPAGGTAVGEAADADARPTDARSSAAGGTSTPAAPAPPTIPGDLRPAVRDVSGTPRPSRPDPATPDDTPDETAGEDGTTGVEEEPTAGTAALRERAALEHRLARAEREIDRLASERDERAAECGELAADLERLRERVDRICSSGSGRADRPNPGQEGSARRNRSTAAALGGTDLFVRYRSRDGPTLADAHEGRADSEAVGSNVVVEVHTRFDREQVAVDGVPFDTFLPETLEHALVTWFARDLQFAVREAGRVDALRALYDAVPRIDRADLRGTVGIGDGDGEDADDAAFDVVCRDRFGDPLVGVNVHDARTPATREEMAALLRDANEVAAARDAFAAAFLVTSSFFDPGALELVDEATTDGGLLGGGTRASYVRTARRRGYHLCLVEARDRRFRLTHPELRVGCDW